MLYGGDWERTEAVRGMLQGAPRVVRINGIECAEGLKAMYALLAQELGSQPPRTLSGLRKMLGEASVVVDNAHRLSVVCLQQLCSIREARVLLVSAKAWETMTAGEQFEAEPLLEVFVPPPDAAALEARLRQESPPEQLTPEEWARAVKLVVQVCFHRCTDPYALLKVARVWRPADGLPDIERAYQSVCSLGGGRRSGLSPACK